MKKYLPVVVTLLVGIAVGGGCMFLLLSRLIPSAQVSQGDSVEKRDEGDTDDGSLDGRFKVTTGAAPGYIEDKACAECHQELFDAYQQVGMANSFSRPSSDNLVEDFDKGHFFHKPSQRHYEMLQLGDRLIFRRYQLDEAGKPINEFERQVDWILGSGNHARNYLYQTEAGELYQFPVAWYPQEDRWAMAPNFDAAEHEGIYHAVTRDCMFCHNAYPEVPEGSDRHHRSQYFPRDLPQGLGCQRCHGPGAEHIASVESGSSSEEVAALFHREGTLLATFEDDGVYKGRDAVLAWYKNYHAEFRSRLRHLRHKISNILITWKVTRHGWCPTWTPT